MNWFQKLLNNPNAHIAAGILSGAASIKYPEYSVPLQTIAGALGISGIALPETKPVAPIAEPVLPPAQAGGSYHAIDYANLAAALIAQFAKKK